MSEAAVNALDEDAARLHLRERQILDCLSEMERACWVRWAIGGLVPAAIAHKVGMTPTEVRLTLERAREKLQVFAKSDHQKPDSLRAG